MRAEVAQQLLEINRQFYSEFALSFSESRGSPQPGFLRLLEAFPQAPLRAVDVGCGNGRFGRTLRLRFPAIEYTGIDASEELLAIARDSMPGTFLRRDISGTGFLAGLGEFDLCACLATLQHIPGRENRLTVMTEMAAHLAPGGHLVLSNWQFKHSERQRRKILDWDRAGLRIEDVEPDDYLLSWQRDGRGLRYVHLLDRDEVAWLAGWAALNVTEEFRSDGREGNLNLYSILVRPGTLAALPPEGVVDT